MNRGRIERAVKRLSIQVWEHLKDEEAPVLVGLNERGHATARLLAKELTGLSGITFKAHQYNVDGDMPLKKIPDCNGKPVLLIDDVIFSGKTMFSALSDVCSSYEPSRIDILTLIDRGHRKYPLQTELCGKTVPTKTGEHIEVMLENGELRQAVLFKN